MSDQMGRVCRFQGTHELLFDLKSLLSGLFKLNELELMSNFLPFWSYKTRFSVF